jgi:general stress protein 26
MEKKSTHEWQPADERTPVEARERLAEILRDQRTVMLLSHDAQNVIQGRPMAAARVDPDGTMYFATGIDSTKVSQVLARPEVAIAAMGATAQAIVRGTAEVRRERALIDELWSDGWKVWFPDGKDDPTIAIVVVRPLEATYWDQSGHKGLSFLWRVVKARATGTAVEPKPTDVGHVPPR